MQRRYVVADIGVLPNRSPSGARARVSLTPDFRTEVMQRRYVVADIGVLPTRSPVGARARVSLRRAFLQLRQRPRPIRRPGPAEPQVRVQIVLPGSDRDTCMLTVAEVRTPAEHWSLLRRHVVLSAIIKFWLHICYVPGSKAVRRLSQEFQQAAHESAL